MSSNQLLIVSVLFAAVIIFSVVVLTVAFRIRRKRFSAQRSGPGSATTPVSRDPRQCFGPALAAPYARREWHDTRGARRVLTAEQTYFGYGCVLPYQALRSLLIRDWDVRNSEDARDRVAGALQAAVQAAEGGAGGAPQSMAFDLARFANLVRWCGSIGYLGEAEARHASDVLGTIAASSFDGWDQFGEHYLIGLRDYTRRGVKPFEQSVAWLRTDPESPWRSLPWPATGG